MPVSVNLISVLLSSASFASAAADPVVAEVLARDTEIAAAHGRGDMETYRAGLSSRYVYIDIAGKRVTADDIGKRREDDRRRVVSSETSEEEAIRVSDTVVLLRGLDRSLATYYGGLPRVGITRWTALWVREDDGVWRLTADTATPVLQGARRPFVHAPQTDATFAALAGRWALALDPPMVLTLTPQDGSLIGTLSGDTVRFKFRPASPSHFFAEERPFELRFAVDGQSLDLMTWGTATRATRVPD